MTKRVIVLDFEYDSLSYQAFSEIKQMQANQEIQVEQMAVITHLDDGTHQFTMNDFIDFTGNDHGAKNSTIGMLIGILGGPLGMLLGWFAGSMIGSVQDAKEITNATSIFEHVSSEIQAGKTGVVLLADEEDNRPLNRLIFDNLGGHIARLDYDEVEEEVLAAQQLEAKVKEKTKESWDNRKKDTMKDE